MKKIKVLSSVFTLASAAVFLVALSPRAWADYACCLGDGSCLNEPDETTCHNAGGTAFFSGQVCGEVDCGHHETGANCSPGYYKTHPEEWCSTASGYPGSNLSRNCASGADCGTLLGQLAARGPGSEAIRGTAKSFLDMCFGTGANTPCTED